MEIDTPVKTNRTIERQKTKIERQEDLKACTYKDRKTQDRTTKRLEIRKTNREGDREKGK